MTTHPESAAHIAAQHRPGFLHGVDFQPDSRLIEWPDSCADEGAHVPVPYEVGHVAAEKAREWRDGLLWAAIVAGAVLGVVLSVIWPMGWSR